MTEDQLRDRDFSKAAPISDSRTELKKLWQKEIENDPDLNQGLDVAGSRKRKKEQFSAAPWEFTRSGITAELRGSPGTVLWALASLTNKYRNTRASNEMIAQWAGVCLDTVKRMLRQLEFYHLIGRRNLRSSRTKRKRIITLLRWDTAKPRLIKEGKIKVDESGKVVFVKPYPFMRVRKCQAPI